MAIIEKLKQKDSMTAIREAKTKTSIKNGSKSALLEKKCFTLSGVLIIFKQQYHKLMKSKLPHFLFIISYIFICILGSLVAANTWIKHRYSINYTSYIPLPTEKNNSNLFADELQLKENESKESLASVIELMYNESEPQSDKQVTSCYEPLEDKRRENAKYWTEGVAIVIVGALGLLGNTFSIFVFRRSRGNKGFHTLLIILAMSDNLLIIDSFIQKSLIPYFTSNAPFEPYWFKISNPYFWHPFKGIILTMTIYLMVAISAERFRAICYPLSKRQSPYKYFAVVIVTSIVLKFPRFFHFKLIYMNDAPEYWTTPIIEDPSYIRFSSYWDDLFTTGFLPLAISMFFNLKIYLKIKDSAKMKCARYVGTGLVEKTKSISRRRQSSPAFSRCRQPLPPAEIETLILNEKQNPLLLSIQKNHCISVSAENINSIHFQLAKSNSMPCMKVNRDHENKTFEPGKDRRDARNSKERKVNQRPLEKTYSSQNNCKAMPSTKSTQIKTLKPSLQRLMNNKLDPQEHDRIQKIETFPVGNSQSNSIPRTKQPMKLKVRTEKSAIVFALIVTLFLLTHSYRMALKVYEVALPNSFSVETFEMCFSLERNHVPITFYILFHLNNLFIVVNSSITFVVWNSVDKEFRKTATVILNEAKEMICFLVVNLWKY